MSPRATVVVPTRDRPGSLAGCLASLADQTLADHEVVVVDDGSVAQADVAAVVARFERARLVRAGGDGPARARNLGAAAARAEIVAFTDDDCRPEPGWLAALVARLDAGASVVAGPTLNARPDDPVAAAAQTVTNHLVEHGLDPATGTVAFAPTSNLAVTAELARAAPFDESYPLAAGEDRAWCDAVIAAGHAIAYEPEARVQHHQDLTVGRFWHQQVRYGRGARRFHRQASHRGTGQAPAFYLGLVAKGFRQGVVTGGLVVAAQLATAVGLVSEAWAGRRDGR